MIHHDMHVQWMDVDSQKVYNDSIGNMFQMYCHKAVDLDNVSEILFNSENNIVKVTDSYGWTDLRSVRKIKSLETWIILSVYGNQLKVTGDTLIPVYYPDIIVRGFHGETIYKYEIKSVKDLLTSDKIMLRRSPNKFSTCAIHRDQVNNEGFGYEIRTRSEFFNCENLYLIGGVIL